MREHERQDLAARFSFGCVSRLYNILLLPMFLRTLADRRHADAGQTGALGRSSLVLNRLAQGRFAERCPTTKAYGL